MKNRSLDTIKYIIMAINALLTVPFSKLVFRNIGYNPSGTKPIREVISLKAENIIAYAFSELFALIMIFLIWTLIFYIVKNFKKSYIFFIVLYMVGTVVLFLLWPEVFTYRKIITDDNLVSYATALRLTPDYWHSFYQSIVYAATMLVIPARFSISLFQWSVFMFTLAYIFFKSEKYAPKFRWAVLSVFLFPNALQFITYSYRVCIYMSVLAVYVAIVVFDMLEKRKRTIIDYVWIAALAAFISVWRSEGIIIGALTYVVYVIYSCNRDIKSLIKKILLYAAFFLLIVAPQKIGDAKYYGKDYSLVNSFDTLYYILNSEEANLDYKGIEVDYAALSAVTPVEDLKEKALEGYRNYNYFVRGNSDINQSTVDTKTAKEYIRAYHNIIKHNLVLTAEIKCDMFLAVLGFNPRLTLKEVRTEDAGNVEWHYVGWDIGYAEYYFGDFINDWRYVPFKFRIVEKSFRTARTYSSFVKEKKIYGFTLLCLIAANIYISIVGLISLFKKQYGRKMILGLISASSLLSLFAIIAVMPAAVTMYFFPTFSIMIFMSYMYLITKKA